MLCRSLNRAGLAFFASLLLGLTAPLAVQAADVDRAQAQLDAARALIDPSRAYHSAKQYAELVPLEVKAQRPEKARELGYLVVGYMQEDKPETHDDYLHLIAQIDLEQNNTQAALTTLERITKRNAITDRLYLSAIHQTAERFGLQRAVDLAREQFPHNDTRTDIYRKLCYTLANTGQAKLAKEFIDVVMDLLEIYKKIDAYRFAAAGMHNAGDTDGAADFLEVGLAQASAYTIASTRASMLLDIAYTYKEIGRPERGREVLALAQTATDQIEPDYYGRGKAIRDLAQAWAALNDRDRALALLAHTEDTQGHDKIYKILIENDLAAGNIDRAKALHEQHNVYIGNTFEVQVAFAALDRGETDAAFAAFSALSDGYVIGDWQRQAAAGFARHGQHQALSTLLPKFKGTHQKYQFHLGAAEGYLAQ